MLFIYWWGVGFADKSTLFILKWSCKKVLHYFLTCNRSGMEGRWENCTFWPWFPRLCDYFSWRALHSPHQSTAWKLSSRWQVSDLNWNGNLFNHIHKGLQSIFIFKNSRLYLELARLSINKMLTDIVDFLGKHWLYHLTSFGPRCSVETLDYMS